MRRAVVALGAAVVLAAAAVSYSIAVAQSPVTTAAASALQSGRVYFRDGSGQIESVGRDDPGGVRTPAGISCRRFAAATTTAVCLTADTTGVLPTTNALVLDRELHETRRLQLAGGIKSLGRHEVAIVLHPEVTATIPLEVVPA